MFTQARLIGFGIVVSLFISLGLYSWYWHSKAESGSKKIKTLENKAVTHKVDISATAIHHEAVGEIKQVDKEIKDEIDSSVGTHTRTF